MGKLICHCGKLACWGIEKCERCGIHKNIDDINIVNKSKKCREINCTLKPGYGLEKNRPICCASHKTEDMWVVSKKQCEINNCLLKASYGIDKQKPIRCYLHKQNDDIYVLKKKKCINETCDKIPTYGKKNCQAEYCKEHKLDEYVDVKHPSCKFGDCNKRPTFGNNDGKAIYCKEHKQDDNVDVLNKRCEYINCNKYPNYGVVSGIALSCLDHKKDNYIRSFKNQVKERYHKNKNRPELIQKHKDYYQNNKEMLIIKSKYYYNTNYIPKLISTCNIRSKTKNFNCDISLDFIYYKLKNQHDKCIYCKCKLDLIADRGNRKMNLISVDRIKSNIGYIMGNVQLTCMFCNYAKNRFTDLEYKQFITCLQNKDNSNYSTGERKASYKWTSQYKLLNTEWLQKQLDTQNWKCYYSGLELIPNKTKTYMFQPSVERLDCNIGHTPENCVIICLSLNYGRNNCNIDDFKSHLEKITN